MERVDEASATWWFDVRFALPVAGPLCLAATMAVSLTTAGCAEHHYYRVYDPYYRDYHVWNDNEVVYYHRWAAETHRDPNRLPQNSGRRTKGLLELAAQPPGMIDRDKPNRPSQR